MIILIKIYLLRKVINLLFLLSLLNEKLIIICILISIINIVNAFNLVILI
jgi:hypothetical protein